jgi:hypothetical protein
MYIPIWYAGKNLEAIMFYYGTEVALADRSQTKSKTKQKKRGGEEKNQRGNKPSKDVSASSCERIWWNVGICWYLLLYNGGDGDDEDEDEDGR